MQMMKQRNGPTTPANSFSNSWTGFDKPGPIAVNRKLLRGAESSETRVSPTYAKLQSMFTLENVMAYMPVVAQAHIITLSTATSLQETLTSVTTAMDLHVHALSSSVNSIVSKFEKMMK